MNLEEDNPGGGNENFQAYRLFLLREIRNLNAALRELDRKLDDVVNAELRKISVELAYLKMKAGIWGGLGGLIPLMIAIGIAWLSSKLGQSAGGKP